MGINTPWSGSRVQVWQQLRVHDQRAPHHRVAVRDGSGGGRRLGEGVEDALVLVVVQVRRNLNQCVNQCVDGGATPPWLGDLRPSGRIALCSAFAGAL